MDNATIILRWVILSSFRIGYGSVIFHLVEAAPNNPKVSAAILEFLSRSLDSAMRIATLNALANPNVKDQRVITMIISSLGDPDQGVRAAAAQAIGPLDHLPWNKRNLLYND